ncbi:hypothetical protein SERLADRAFT_413456 [Serpula lacrymans var. lacrymans S7.9]|uniref:Uncharacterized protein n=1 Tax=Serpula lacrymans var. lacrymans (strain S7.9) TaxID=578457 RepID=F8NLS0_SERL9|nr:uncharacterized protein SERLADRAFT_413456 [Serpula lacrymans var. lacrymans S7.9]EGO28622.1 hypothetical protein SERLADRAFT_413456 [Serpula lacrymans var. lacrymans S7.9]
MNVTLAEELMRGPLMGVFISMLCSCISSIMRKITGVFRLWILETLHAALSMSVMDHYLVRGFSDLKALVRVDWEITLLCLANQNTNFQVSIIAARFGALQFDV